MALLQPDTARIGHPPGNPAEDRVPGELASGTPRELREALTKLIGADQVLDRAIDLFGTPQMPARIASFRRSSWRRAPSTTSLLC